MELLNTTSKLFAIYVSKVLTLSLTSLTILMSELSIRQ
jgi:hypothetical protein